MGKQNAFLIIYLIFLFIPIPSYNFTLSSSNYPLYPLNKYKLDKYVSEGNSVSIDILIDGNYAYIADGYDGIIIRSCKSLIS